MIATPVDFSGTPWAARTMAPRLGEHTGEILRSLGRSDSEIEALEAAGIVRRGVPASASGATRTDPDGQAGQAPARPGRSLMGPLPEP